jgi:hypothetical protein
MPRFVILTHDWPVPHWDLLLEQGEVLRAWRLMAEPVPDQEIPLEAIPDHRKLYLDYEGPVSGERGSVARWDWGAYDLLEDDPDELTLRLEGRRIHGTVRLSRKDSSSWVWFLT